MINDNKHNNKLINNSHLIKKLNKTFHVLKFDYSVEMADVK